MATPCVLRSRRSGASQAHTPPSRASFTPSSIKSEKRLNRPFVKRYCLRRRFFCASGIASTGTNGGLPSTRSNEPAGNTFLFKASAQTMRGAPDKSVKLR